MSYNHPYIDIVYYAILSIIGMDSWNPPTLTFEASWHEAFITIRTSPTIPAVGSGGERRILKWIIQGLSSMWNYCNHHDYKTLRGEFGSHQCLVKTEVLCYQRSTSTWQTHNNFFPLSYG